MSAYESNNRQANYKIEIKWLNVFVLLYLHIAALYGFYLMNFASTTTIVVGFIFAVFSGFGTTVVAHRYFTHKAFKVNNSFLKWIFIVLQTLTAQEPVLNWARDHRVHHKCKYNDTL
jgi:stearoyl-CoA desaturase (delta-9 desaturase)